MATSIHENDSLDSTPKMGISGFAQSESRDFESPNVNSKPAVKPRSDVIRMQPTRKHVSSVNSKNKLVIPVLAVVLALLLGVGAYKYIFENVNFVTPIPGQNDESGDGASVPASEGNRWENPINGLYFSNEDASKFKDKKPIAVMVNNYVDARPSSGLSQADVVYEAVAEGGITRLMPIFFSRIPDMVISLRSARFYFAELASPYAAHYVHWGAAHMPPCQKAGTCDEETDPRADAYNRIVELGLPNLDAGNYACQNDAPECAFGRDSKRLAQGLALEHTAFARLDKVYEKAKEIRPEESWHKYIPLKVQWKFKDDAPLEERGDIGLATTAPITYNYWDTMAGFNVKWEYDKEKNEYVRYQGNVKQTDYANSQELRAKSIIVRFTNEVPFGDKKNHLNQQIAGTGDALIFQDGKVIQAKWSRPDAETLDKYTDLSGNEVQFVRGQIWVQLIQIGNKVNYQASAPAQTTGGN